MTHVDVWLSPSDQIVRRESLDRETTCVVIDVLRATSSIITALASGASAVEPVDTVEEALRRKEADPSVLLAGERGGLRITVCEKAIQFDFGNSPLEFLNPVVRGRKIVMTTTNGTQAIRQCAGCGNLIVAALVNLSAVVDFVCRIQPPRLVIVAAGTGDQPALEDIFVAGAFIDRLASQGSLWKQELSDAATLAVQVYHGFGKDALCVFRKCANGRRLIRLGLEQDLSFCAQEDRFSVVGVSSGVEIVTAS